MQRQRVARRGNIIVHRFSGCDDLNRLDDYRQFRPRVAAVYPLLTQVLLYLVLIRYFIVD